MQSTELWPGDIVWADLAPTRGREQAGRRPVLVVANRAYLGLVADLAIVVPLTTRDRGWDNHVEVGAELPERSWAMTEQVRTVDRLRLRGLIAGADDETMDAIRVWLVDFLDL
ncbi:MAG: type II toxin-antitoxin system PemK/MazF family toxin [Leifsonia xyli]|nr:MAG: type II toxin-antitoxin system PemK/MazF family toxin [Leifsonia xyli]